MEDLVKASELQGGEWFRKRRGEHRHLVISESAARFHKLPEGKVYGVSLETGNMSAVEPDTLVVRVDPFRKEPKEPLNVWTTRHWKLSGELCKGGPSCSCIADGGYTTTPPKATQSPNTPPMGEIMLGCGVCEGCEGDGDCLYAGEHVSILADEGLDDRF